MAYFAVAPHILSSFITPKAAHNTKKTHKDTVIVGLHVEPTNIRNETTADK